MFSTFHNYLICYVLWPMYDSLFRFFRLHMCLIVLQDTRKSSSIDSDADIARQTCMCAIQGKQVKKAGRDLLV